jgi:hypothetical protein
LVQDFTGEWGVNDVSEPVLWGQNVHSDVLSMYIGTAAQAICEKSGDAVGINWGFLHVGMQTANITNTMNAADLTRSTFAISGGAKLPAPDRVNMPRAASNDWPVIAFSWNAGTVTATAAATNTLIVAYDDQYSIKYFGQLLRPLWRKEGAPDWHILDLLADSLLNYDAATKDANTYDESLYQQLSAAAGGGKPGQQYAELTTLAYRQTMAGIQIVWNDELQTPWVFMKEISSDGDLSTVDVIFPAAPFFVALNPDLLKMMLIPIMHYANNDTFVTYNRTYAPHHLGFYPIGYILTQDQENMPIEETGNMILMITALDGGAGNYSWIWPKYETLLHRWSSYLIRHLPDPGDQLCTDDFEGPSPHNVNLAAKGIVALKAFAKFYTAVGDPSTAQQCAIAADKYATQWLSMANDSTHFRLQYNLPNTTSLKYNILWQYLLTLDGPFPSNAMSMELNYYSTLMNRYGVPLDNRALFTKLDWQHWIATMAAAEGLNSVTESIIDATWRWANETPSRVPLTDWYMTDSGKQQGFQARPVVGALYALLALKQTL